MAEDRIQRKDLWNQLGNIKKRKVWFEAAEKLGLIITQSKGGSSHYAARIKDFPATDIRSLVSVINSDLRKDINEAIFKNFIKKGFKEDDIWIALGLLERKEEVIINNPEPQT